MAKHGVTVHPSTTAAGRARGARGGRRLRPSCLVVLALATAGGPCRAQQADPRPAVTPGDITVHAAGAQIYECRADAAGDLAWRFREPLATLFQDGKTVGRHFAGPTWEMADGSAVVGRVEVQTPGATARDVPLLTLAVAGRSGRGELSAATTIRRLNTRGGAFSGPCDTPGAIHVEPYTADYVFSDPS